MIRCYSGRRGQGKSYSMVAEAVRWFRKNKLPIFSNMADVRFPMSVYVPNIFEIPFLRCGLFIFDEASSVLNSRKAMSNPQEVLVSFRQSRKQALDMLYTTQGAEDCDKTLRDLTDDFVACRRFKIGGRFMIVQRIRENGEKVGLLSGLRFEPLTADIAELYNTDELIEQSGGAASEIGAAAELLRRGRPHASRPALEEPRWKKKVSAYYWQAGVAWSSAEAMRAADWLVKRELLEPGEPGGALKVQKEILRQRWLAMFDIGPENVPDTCCPENPWIPGYGPQEVKAKQEALEEELAIEKLAIRRMAARRVA